MKTVSSARADAVSAAAGHVLACIGKKSDAVIASGALDEELLVWDAVAAGAAARGIRLADVRFLAVCEFEGPARETKASVRGRLLAHLIERTDAREENLYVPDAADPAAFDEKLTALGGLDLAVLGLGNNARVGFNEPATPFDTYTHCQKLTARTRAELAPLFGGEENVPLRGVTMGFQTLCRARDIIVIALGGEKATALYRMLYGRDDSIYPAAFLQLPANVTVYADEDASAKL